MKHLASQPAPRHASVSTVKKLLSTYLFLRYYSYGKYIHAVMHVCLPAPAQGQTLSLRKVHTCCHACMPSCSRSGANRRKIEKKVVSRIRSDFLYADRPQA